MGGVFWSGSDRWSIGVGGLLRYLMIFCGVGFSLLCVNICLMVICIGYCVW